MEVLTMNKLLKQFISITLSLFLLVSVSTAFASSGNGNQSFNFSIEKNYGEMFLESIGHTEKLSNPIPLFNLDDELEAVNFSMGKNGYIIINVKDLSIPELSFENSSPFKSHSETYVYNGPLAYMTKTNGKFIDLMSSKIVKEPGKIKFKYKRDFIDKTKVITDLRENIEDNQEITVQ